MERYEYVHKNLKQIIIDNFLGGISWGLGATIGVTVIFAFFGFILSKIDLIPIVGTFVAQIMDFIAKNNQTLLHK